MLRISAAEQRWSAAKIAFSNECDKIDDSLCVFKKHKDRIRLTDALKYFSISRSVKSGILIFKLFFSLGKIKK